MKKGKAMAQTFFSLKETEKVLREPLTALRHELHAHPERSGQEVETTRRLRALFSQPPFELSGFLLLSIHHRTCCQEG